MVPDVKIILRGDSVIKKEMIAMLLAGGQKPSRCPDFKSGKAGSSIRRKYRIIDFPLVTVCGRCGHSQVLTQYQPLRLNTHIGISIPWDLDRNVDVTVLRLMKFKDRMVHRYSKYRIYQNLNYMETQSGYVLILSGDHIYKMDYKSNA